MNPNSQRHSHGVTIPLPIFTGPGGPLGIGIPMQLLQNLQGAMQLQPPVTSQSSVNPRPQISQSSQQQSPQLNEADSSDESGKMKNVFPSDPHRIIIPRSTSPMISSSSNSGPGPSWVTGTNNQPHPSSQASLVHSLGYPTAVMHHILPGTSQDQNLLYGITLGPTHHPHPHPPNLNHNHNQAAAVLSLQQQQQHPPSVNSSPPSLANGNIGNPPPGNPGINPTTISSAMSVNNNGTIAANISQSQSQQQQQQPQKEIIHCKSCTLFPPNSNCQDPTTRERPPGCRTVFVGGLPENIRDEIIHEIFDVCGEITTIRMSKKNFCHIRFLCETFVDKAIYLSGYRIRIGSNSDNANIGRLHVDYAQARDDLYEFECRQRQFQREQRHRERLEIERLQPESPPLIPHYTDHEVPNLLEKIKNDDSFLKAVKILITWLERGDCMKKNVNNFYSMIQSTNSHVRRLLNEKSQYEEELNKAKEQMRQRIRGLIMQFGQIERVFQSASHKKVWDHFTKAQRKNIDVWKKQASEIKSMQLEEVLINERADEEMDFSEEEGDNNEICISKKMRFDQIDHEHLNNLKEDNENLKCQLEASKNEVDLIKADLKAEIEQRKLLEQQLFNLRQKYAKSNEDSSNDCVIIERSPEQKINSTFLENCDSSQSSQNGSTILSNSNSTGNNHQNLNENNSTSDGLNNLKPKKIQMSEEEVRLLGLISIFLLVHPLGASLDYIWSYIQKLIPTVQIAQIESTLNIFNNLLFKQEFSGIGANFERRWIFCGFNLN